MTLLSAHPCYNFFPDVRPAYHRLEQADFDARRASACRRVSLVQVRLAEHTAGALWSAPLSGCVVLEGQGRVCSGEGNRFLSRIFLCFFSRVFLLFFPPRRNRHAVNNPLLYICCCIVLCTTWSYLKPKCQIETYDSPPPPSSLTRFVRVTPFRSDLFLHTSYTLFSNIKRPRLSKRSRSTSTSPST